MAEPVFCCVTKSIVDDDVGVISRGHDVGAVPGFYSHDFRNMILTGYIFLRKKSTGLELLLYNTCTIDSDVFDTDDIFSCREIKA